MGRISVPIMNKTGYTMYWNSMWDDKINYNRSLKEDIFLKEFVYLFFEGGSNFMIYLNLKNFQEKLEIFKKKYFFHTKKLIKKNDIGTEISFKLVIKRKKKFRPYLSKIWLIRYQNWVIIYFYAYSFNLSSFYKKSLDLKKKYSKYANILSIYYDVLLKLRYNYNLYKKSLNLDFF